MEASYCGYDGLAAELCQLLAVVTLWMTLLWARTFIIRFRLLIMGRWWTCPLRTRRVVLWTDPLGSTATIPVATILPMDRFSIPRSLLPHPPGSPRQTMSLSSMTQVGILTFAVRYTRLDLDKTFISVLLLLTMGSLLTRRLVKSPTVLLKSVLGPIEIGPVATILVMAPVTGPSDSVKYHAVIGQFCKFLFSSFGFHF